MLHLVAQAKRAAETAPIKQELAENPPSLFALRDRPWVLKAYLYARPLCISPG
jgi:hypothetical protein